jgi:hypothetical protein
MNDIEEIKNLKARYFRFLDTKDWENFRSIFTDDVVVDVSGSGGEVYRGLDPYMDYIHHYVSQLKTVHHGHMPEITLLSDTLAAGIWSMEDWVDFPNGRELNGKGHYFEKYEKVDGEWKIKELVLTRLRIQTREVPRWG